LLLFLGITTSKGPFGILNIMCTSCSVTLILQWASGREQQQALKFHTNHTASYPRIMLACKCKKPPKLISLMTSFCLSFRSWTNYCKPLGHIWLLNSSTFLRLIFDFFNISCLVFPDPICSSWSLFIICTSTSCTCILIHYTLCWPCEGAVSFTHSKATSMYFERWISISCVRLVAGVEVEVGLGVSNGMHSSAHPSSEMISNSQNLIFILGNHRLDISFHMWSFHLSLDLCVFALYPFLQLHRIAV